MGLKTELFLTELCVKCDDTNQAIYHYERALRGKVERNVHVTREDLERLEEFYIEKIAKLLKVAEYYEDIASTATKEYEIKVIKEHSDRLSNELIEVFHNALEYLNIFDVHFYSLEMRAYLLKIKADFLRTKARIFGLKDFENAVSLSTSYYKRAEQLLDKNSWLCPYKLDVHFNYTRLKILLDPNDIYYEDLADKYDYGFLNSDRVTEDWKYYNEVLRSIGVFINKKNNVHEITLDALISNKYCADFMNIVSRKEYLKSYYFF